MARLFGTDGVRGVANAELSCELAMNIGRAAAYLLTKEGKHKARILIGKDTRMSSDMLEHALAAGICSVGADAVLLGVVPTPAVAYLTRLYKADAGIVISASHNPMEFNGIKIFNREGFKLADAMEDEIAALIADIQHSVPYKTHEEIGTVSTAVRAAEDYVEYLESCVEGDLSGLRVAFDCANGAASKTAQMLFTRLGASCFFTAAEPDGSNINRGVGSTHLENIKKLTLENGCHIGIAFDGDADRCLAVDEKGSEIDGDRIIAIFAKYLKQRGELAKDTAVVTVMTNMGFMELGKKHGFKSVRTAVGDRYVLEEMRKNGYCLGGEQSGHIILLKHSTTGDGELTAALLLQILKSAGCAASELAGELRRYPQILVNVRTTSEGKAQFKEDEELAGFIESQQQDMFEEGRVLVRLSGTEPLIRIMVEGKQEQRIREVAQRIEEQIKTRIPTL